MSKRSAEITPENIINPPKVYCANCKFLLLSPSGPEFSKCSATLKAEYVGFSIGYEYITSLIESERFPNAKGDCDMYKPKRKWWKFWVKP